MDMKTIIFTIIALISSSVCAQESVRIIKLKSSDAETVTGVLDVLQDDDKRPSTDQMTEAIFKRLDTDKNGSLSLKEFKTFDPFHCYIFSL
jgi:Ca2+-binding EF-hand superfamily protein